MAEEKKRILTGVRPTGSLHLGHYAGALENWLRLQTEYECYFLIADYQVSDYADDFARVRNSVWEVALDWLAVGLDPNTAQTRAKSTAAPTTICRAASERCARGAAARRSSRTSAREAGRDGAMAPA